MIYTWCISTSEEIKKEIILNQVWRFIHLQSNKTFLLLDVTFYFMCQDALFFFLEWAIKNELLTQGYCPGYCASIFRLEVCAVRIIKAFTHTYIFDYRTKWFNPLVFSTSFFHWIFAAVWFFFLFGWHKIMDTQIFYLFSTSYLIWKFFYVHLWHLVCFAS